MTLYRVDSPINREQRNNLNLTFDDILRKFTNLQLQINILGGETSVEEVLLELTQAINNANTTVIELQGLIADSINDNESAAQSAIDNLNTTLSNQLTAIDDKLTLMQTAINAADEATTNANTATINTNDAINDARQAIADINSLIASMSYKGEYSNSSTYSANNIVRYGKNSYVALKNVIGILPNDDGVNWRLIAVGGIDGTGAVSTVNDIDPDANGNVNLQASDIGAASATDLVTISESVGELDTRVTQHLADKANPHNVTSEQVNVISGLPPTALSQEYPKGVSLFSIHGGNEYQSLWVNEINSFLGTNHNTGGVRLYIETVKNTTYSSGCKQQITITSNYTGDNGKTLGILVRAHGTAGSLFWSEWNEIITDRIISSGNGSPEGVVIANVGSLYRSKDGGTSTTLYVKTSGSGNTGWTAK